MTIRPHITLLFLLSVFTVLLSLGMVFEFLLPEQAIRFRYGQPEDSNYMKIGFFSPSEFFNSEDDGYKDISAIIAQNEQLTDTLISQLADVATEVMDTTRADADSLRSSIRRIEFPDNNRSILHPVFRAMEKAKSQGKVIRIIHYGDSQIEGDRITSLIRNKLQTKFGGEGVGLVPAKQVYDFRYALLQENSENWFRYTLYGKRDTTITHSRFGLLGSFGSFTPQPRDTNTIDTTTKQAWISFEKSPYSYTNTKQFSRCRLFYGYNNQPFTAQLYLGEELADEGIYSPSSSLKKIEWSFQEPVSNVTLQFTGSHSPEIYCIALDGKSGVAVDNVAMRGSSGLIFTKTNKQLLGEMLKELDVNLVIMQFGGNVVPNIRKNYTYYENWLYAQMKRIKEVSPNTQIVLMGVADMSMKDGTRYVSYPNIPLVRDAMKRAAFRAGAGYWDMYEAMGGKNSMPSWVFAQPSLATSDFVHFRPRGAKLIANMFYNALIYEYSIYKQKSQTPVKEKEEELVAEHEE